LIAERRVPELILVLGSQPAGDVSHKPGGRLPLLSARLTVTPQPLRGLLPISLLGEQRHKGCEPERTSRYQKGKTSLDLTATNNKNNNNNKMMQKMMGVLGWQWHQLLHMQTVCTCTGCCPTNSVKALKEF